VAADLESLRGRPVPQVEGVRDDARPGSELPQELGSQPAIEVGGQVERHDRGRGQIGLEEVLVAEAQAVGQPQPPGPLGALGHQGRIDLQADPSRTPVLRGRDEDAAVARPQVIDDVIGSYVR
jgi:hypothetical protein